MRPREMESVDSNDALANRSVGRGNMGDVVEGDEGIVASILGPRIDGAGEVGEVLEEARGTYRQCRWERRQSTAEEDDERFMRLALRLAERAHDEGEVPVRQILSRMLPVPFPSLPLHDTPCAGPPSVPTRHCCVRGRCHRDCRDQH